VWFVPALTFGEPYDSPVDIDRIGTELARLYSHKRWLILADVAAGTGALVDQLRKWGGEEFLTIAGALGLGDEPETEVVLMPSPPGSVMEGFRRFAAQVIDPPAHVLEAVQRFDADGTARLLGPMFAAPNEFLSRHNYGSRPTHWEELEDKTRADEVWDEAGVPRVDSWVVSLAEAPSAAADLAGPLGTVWAADNTEGWHGGGEYTRWVPDADSAAGVVEDLAGRAGRVRVMPFLDGTPCSIHGVVTSDGVAALRPVELLILRRKDRAGFVYAGVATTWDPPEEIRQEMRAAARSVGAVLSRRLEYRGSFSIDGVCTAQGFRPTELNPRFSVGYAVQANTVEGLHGAFFARALVEGDLSIGASDLESAILESADRNRAVRLGVPIKGSYESATIALGPDGKVSDDGWPLEIGPSPSGSFMFWKVDPSQVPQGPSFAPTAAAAIRVATEEWGLEVPEVEPAPDVSRG
jgi:hypothetical protein